MLDQDARRAARLTREREDAALVRGDGTPDHVAAGGDWTGGGVGEPVGAGV